MRIALATCSALPEWEIDDEPLHDALQERGVTIERPAWDDATYDWSGVDLCLIRTTWDYTQRVDAFVQWAEQISSRTMLFNPADVVRWNVRKTYLRDLEARDVPTIPTIWCRPGESASLTPQLAEAGWLRAMIKPAVGATAHGTMRFTVDEVGLPAAREHLDTLLNAGQTALVQPYYDAVESFGEVSAIYIDGAFSHGVRKIPVPGDYRVQDDYGASDEPYTFTPDEMKQLESIIDAADARTLLYSRVDLLRSPAGDLHLTELELVEPSLFFRHCDAAADRLADALIRRVDDI